MQLSNRELEDYLLFGSTLLGNTLSHPAIRERILKDGYNDERLQQGTALKDQAERSLQLYIARRQEKLAMHVLVRKKFNLVFAEYMGHSGLYPFYNTRLLCEGVTFERFLLISSRKNHWKPLL